MEIFGVLEVKRKAFLFEVFAMDFFKLEVNTERSFLHFNYELPFQRNEAGFQLKCFNRTSGFDVKALQQACSQGGIGDFSPPTG